MRLARKELGKDATVTEVKDLAEGNEMVSKWAERESHHSDRADAYKTFFDIYTEHVAVLSRDYTMSEREQQGA